MERATLEEMIEAVRSDEKVGRGSCSTIDETYTDAELAELIGKCRTTAGAVRAARKVHNTFESYAADIMATAW